VKGEREREKRDSKGVNALCVIGEHQPIGLEATMQRGSDEQKRVWRRIGVNQLRAYGLCGLPTTQGDEITIRLRYLFATVECGQLTTLALMLLAHWRE